MVEDLGQVPAAPDTPIVPDVPATTDTPTGFVNPDGTFIEGWQSRLQDESLRTDKSLATLKEFESMAKSYVHVRKQVPMDKVTIPGVNATDGERNEFYDKVGRPKTSDSYQYQVPEDISTEDLSPEFMKPVFDEFHKAGYTQKQADVAVNLYVNHLREIEKFISDQEDRERINAESALRQKWGTAYPERLHLANRMISENTESQEAQEYIASKIGNDPVVGDFLSNIASRFVEHRIITDVETPSADTDAKIKELMNNPAYMSGTHPDHKAIVRQVQELFRQQAERKKTGTIA